MLRQAPAREVKMCGMASEARHQTPLPTWTLFKSVDKAALTATGLLTFPEYDYDGDWVEPAGGVWDRTPYVNVEHEPPQVASGTVQLKSLPEVGVVPLGITHFDSRSRASSQAFKLVAEGVLPGLSLEYKPVGPLGGPHWKSLGYPSPRLPRDAMEFSRWRGLGWALCARPVQPNALMLLDDAPEEYGKAVRIVELGKLGDEQLAPTIFKSLSAMVGRVTRPASVVGGFKAMGGGLYADAPAGDAQDEQPGLDSGPTPTVRAYKNLAQGILDLIERFDADMDQSEHTGALSRMEQDKERIQSFAEDLNSFGDDVADDVAGKMKRPVETGEEPGEDDAELDLDDDETGEKPEPAEGDEPADAPKKDAKKPKGKPFGKAVSLLVDSAGGIITKAYPSYTPRRFRASEFVPVAEVAPEATPEQKAIEAEADRELRLARKTSKSARPFIDLIQPH